MSKDTYYVWVMPDGRVGWTRLKNFVPEESALMFKTRSRKTVYRLHTACRHGWEDDDGVELLVPGVPEAETVIEAAKRVVEFLKQFFPRMRKDIARWEGYVKDMKEGEDCKQEGEGG